MTVIEKKKVTNKKGTAVGAICPKGYVVDSTDQKVLPVPSKQGLENHKCIEYKSEANAKKWADYYRKQGFKVYQRRLYVCIEK